MTLVQVFNKRLKDSFRKERLVRNPEGYYYFCEGTAMDWETSSIMAFNVNDGYWDLMSLADEYNALGKGYVCPIEIAWNGDFAQAVKHFNGCPCGGCDV